MGHKEAITVIFLNNHISIVKKHILRTKIGKSQIIASGGIFFL